MNLQHIYYHFKNNLKSIERDLEASLGTDQATLRASSIYPLEAGGKRLRPLFVLLSGGLAFYDFDKLKKLAVSMELIHMATLVHDDVIDHASVRRGRKTVRAVWDDQIAMITGDFIFSRALEQLTDLKSTEIHQIFSKTLLHLCQGEIDQYGDLFNKGVSFRQYLHRIKRKTAILFAVSCRLGACVGNAEAKMIRHLHRYGYLIGMAFQLIDDVLDFTGSEQVLGKPVGSDLRQGNVTLPVIYAMQHASPDERDMLYAYLDSEGRDGSLCEMISIVKKTGGIEFTTHLAKRYIHKAIAATRSLPRCRSRQSLQEIACFLVNRTY